MNKRMERLTSVLRLAFLGGATAFVFTPSSTAAHSGHVFQAALRNPVTVDGVLSPGEWDDASMSTFTMCTPARPARMFVKNDATHLYIAVEVQNVRWRFGGPPGSGNDFLNLTFDNDHNGARTIGDNTWNVRGGDGLTVDGYDPNGFGFNYDDAFDGGTVDFATGVTHTNPVYDGLGTYTVEYKGLLDSADDAHDFSLAPGQTVGFYFTAAIVDCSPPRTVWPSATTNGDIVIAAIDTEPPVLTLELEPPVLWPPNHKLASVHASAQAWDAVDPSPQVSLVSITSDEPDVGAGAEDLPHDIQADIGSAAVDFALRAERAPGGDGRIYTVCYEARDVTGNSTRTCATVEVPHDRRAGRSLLASSHASEASSPSELGQIGSATTGGPAAPVALEASAWPNPGKRQSTLAYALPHAGQVRLRIYDVAGHLVASLVDRWQPAGRYTARFLGEGRSGLYLYRLDWDGMSVSGKLAIVQ